MAALPRKPQDDPRSVYSGLYGLANLALARGDRDGARGLLGEGLSREAGDWAMLANLLGTQAIWRSPTRTRRPASQADQDPKARL